MPRVMIMLPIAVAALGIIWIFTIGTIFGLLLVLGGAGALGVNIVPSMVRAMGRFHYFD